MSAPRKDAAGRQRGRGTPARRRTSGTVTARSPQPSTRFLTAEERSRLASLTPEERAHLAASFTEAARESRRELRAMLARRYGDDTIYTERAVARADALGAALGSMIALLEVTLRGCGHASGLLCDECTRHGLQALAAARRAMVHRVKARLEEAPLRHDREEDKREVVECDAKPRGGA